MIALVVSKISLLVNFPFSIGITSKISDSEILSFPDIRKSANIGFSSNL